MVAIHIGEDPADLEEDMNPNDTDRFWVSWTDKLNGDSIESSTWIVPTGFEVEDSGTNQSVIEDGTTYNDANYADISTTLDYGRHLISNEIVTVGGLTWRRGFYVTLDVI